MIAWQGRQVGFWLMYGDIALSNGFHDNPLAELALRGSQVRGTNGWRLGVSGLKPILFQKQGAKLC